METRSWWISTCELAQSEPVWADLTVGRSRAERSILIDPFEYVPSATRIDS